VKTCGAKNQPGRWISWKDKGKTRGRKFSGEPRQLQRRRSARTFLLRVNRCSKNPGWLPLYVPRFVAYSTPPDRQSSVSWQQRTEIPSVSPQARKNRFLLRNRNSMYVKFDAARGMLVATSYPRGTEKCPQRPLSMKCYIPVKICGYSRTFLYDGQITPQFTIPTAPL